MRPSDAHRDPPNDAAPEIVWVPYAADPLRTLAQHLCAQHRDRLPDLTQAVVLLPSLECAPRLRRELLNAMREQGHTALLGPTLTTPRAWVERISPPVARVLHGYARELMLTEALTRHPDLYGKASPWNLTDSLLRLFDELTLHRCALAADISTFHAQLEQAYRIRGNAPRALSRETALVHTLWHAWHEQARASQTIDQNAAYLLQLAQSVTRLPARAHVYVAGIRELSKAESEWINAIAADRACTVLLHGSSCAPPSDADVALQTLARALHAPPTTQQSADARGDFFDTAFALLATPIAERARAFAQRHAQSPLIDCLEFFSASGDEEEACAIDVQIRAWLLDGAATVGIVTENRRLARRVRAMLERAGVAVDDLSGWALSTTSAASALERWLECVEEDFAYEPLLDVLKSSFVFADMDREQRLAAVYRLEEDIVHNQGVQRDLERYRFHLRVRRERLPDNLSARYSDVEHLLDNLENAAHVLMPFLGEHEHSTRDFMNALLDSVTRLGMLDAWRNDAAGVRVVQELELLARAAETSALRMRWPEFRAWLGRALEKYNFVPPNQGGAVTVLNFAQSALARFDATVIASCEQEYLPSARQTSPFFNEGVRAELGLPTEQQHRAAMLHDFRRLLESAPRVLLTRVSARDGDEVVASPWWDTLHTFHRLAYSTTLESARLALLVNDARAYVRGPDGPPLPTPVAAPRARIDARLVPRTLSVSDYQALIDCPYKFFAAQCLKLKPPEALKEALQKDDFGMRVHQCLQAFHVKVQGLPDPFDSALTPANRDAAIRRMMLIAQAVFARDLEDNFAHRAWLKRWLVAVPSYIDWQIERARHWTIRAAELKQQRALDGDDLSLRGRIDRLDESVDGAGIIDYKTGEPPKLADVIDGESVQLPCYALMTEVPQVVSVECVVIKDDTVTTKTTVAGDELALLRAQNQTRLVEVMRDLRAGEFAPAWGDAHTCEYCDMDGLCRRTSWIEAEQGSSGEQQ